MKKNSDIHGQKKREPTMYGIVKKKLPDVQFTIVHKESTQNWHLYKYCGMCFKTFLFNKNAYICRSLSITLSRGSFGRKGAI